MWGRTIPTIAATFALALVSAQAAAGTIFGSLLNHEPTPFERCREDKPGEVCSWVMTIAQANPGKHIAPRNGTLVKLRLRSCIAGSFVLQFARAVPASDQARGTRSGPAINYRGNPTNCNGGTFIETFNINEQVLQGEYLSVIATRVGFIYNASGDGTLVFQPLLADGAPFRTTTGTGLGSGILLLQVEYNN